MNIHEWVNALEKVLQTLWDKKGEVLEVVAEQPHQKVVLKTEPRSGQYGTVKNVLVLTIQQGSLSAAITFYAEESRLMLFNKAINNWGSNDLSFRNRWGAENAAWVTGNLAVLGIRALAPDTEIPPRPITHWDALEIH